MSARIVRIIAPALLIAHLFIHLFKINAGIWSELYLYNLIGLCAIVIVAFAPRITDPLSKPTLVIALALWLGGSLISSFASFYLIGAQMHHFSNIAYLLFYPFALFA
ncbi:MAG: hypothetical protein F2933_05590, partial [Actinobacteria bacterium]|nr:hypothetical protein [Actinomycetota bacterium]